MASELDRIFEQALALPPSQRSEFVRARASPADAARLEGMIEAYQRAGSFLNDPATMAQAPDVEID